MCECGVLCVSVVMGPPPPFFLFLFLWGGERRQGFGWGDIICIWDRFIWMCDLLCIVCYFIFSFSCREGCGRSPIPIFPFFLWRKRKETFSWGLDGDICLFMGPGSFGCVICYASCVKCFFLFPAVRGVVDPASPPPHFSYGGGGGARNKTFCWVLGWGDVYENKFIWIDYLLRFMCYHLFFSRSEGCCGAQGERSMGMRGGSV